MNKLLWSGLLFLFVVTLWLIPRSINVEQMSLNEQAARNAYARGIAEERGAPRETLVLVAASDGSRWAIWTESGELRSVSADARSPK